MAPSYCVLTLVSLQLGELGLDSLTAVEVGVELEHLIPDRKVSVEFLVQPDTTLAGLFDFLCLSSPPTEPTNVSASMPTTTTPAPGVSDGTVGILSHFRTNPEVIQEESGTLPALLIHDGSGTALVYRLLGNIGRTVLGVHSPGFLDGKGVVSIPDAAHQYAGFARQWLDQHSQGRPRLLVGGYSFGSIIAIALAVAHPELAAGVILLDPPPPGTAGMTSDEVETLMPCELKRSLSALSARALTQIKINAQSLSIDAERQAAHRELVANLRVPVYLINATDPLSHLSGVQVNSSPGSCSEWMLNCQRASIAEKAWSDILGNLLVGTERIAGDHFSMFTRAHAGSTTRAVKQAANVLEAIIT